MAGVVSVMQIPQDGGILTLPVIEYVI
jgi:hypothetical protein